MNFVLSLIRTKPKVGCVFVVVYVTYFPSLLLTSLNWRQCWLSMNEWYIYNKVYGFTSKCIEWILWIDFATLVVLRNNLKMKEAKRSGKGGWGDEICTQLMGVTACNPLNRYYYLCKQLPLCLFSYHIPSPTLSMSGLFSVRSIWCQKSLSEEGDGCFISCFKYTWSQNYNVNITRGTSIVLHCSAILRMQ